MPIKQAAKKAMRQAEKRTQRNKVAMAEIHSLRVKLRKMLADKKTDQLAETIRLLGKKVDKAVARGMIKMNTAARIKSRFMAKVNATKKA